MAFGFYRTVTLDHSQVGTTDQTNFPVLVAGTLAYLATTTNVGRVQNGSGFDVGFYSDVALTSPLSWETELYTATSGAVAYWVKVPTVSHTADTVVYLAYGNSSITTDQSAPTAVWDTNFKSVYHLPNGSTLSGADSTTTANTQTITSATATAGLVDGGAAFSPNAFLRGGNGGVTSPPLTISAWVNLTDKLASYDMAGLVLSSGDADWFRISFASAGPRFVADVNHSGSTFGQALGTTNPNAGTWYLVHGVFVSATSRIVYVNGVSEGTDATNTAPAGVDRFSLGVLDRLTPAEFLKGTLDEVRLSSIDRAADWCLAEYNNQKAGSTFVTLGAEIPLGADSVRRTMFKGIGRGIMNRVG